MLLLVYEWVRYMQVFKVNIWVLLTSSLCLICPGFLGVEDNQGYLWVVGESCPPVHLLGSSHTDYLLNNVEWQTFRGYRVFFTIWQLLSFSRCWSQLKWCVIFIQRIVVRNIWHLGRRLLKKKVKWICCNEKVHAKFFCAFVWERFSGHI